MDEEKPNTKHFDSDDKFLKELGELLSNDSSRKIIRATISKPMYLNEIAGVINQTPPLTKHHVDKLEELGVFIITYKSLTRKGKLHKHFQMIPNLFVTPNHSKEEVEKEGILKRIFNGGAKFAVIGVAFIASSILSKNYFKTTEINRPVPFESSIPTSTTNNLEFLIYPLIILAIALIIERVILELKKKKKGV